MTVLAAAAALWILSSVPRAADAGAYPHLFGTDEVRSENIAPFAKWTAMLKRYSVETSDLTEPCQEETCRFREWRRFLESLGGENRLTQLEAVNRFVNDVPYRSDRRNWGTDDYWATPAQFLEGRGDCEDYAITKYMSLKTLGFAPDDMRLVVVQDESRGMPHAVLVVFLAGEGYVLDNQIERVVPQALIGHYKPYYSINERAWWLHRS